VGKRWHTSGYGLNDWSWARAKHRPTRLGSLSTGRTRYRIVCTVP